MKRPELTITAGPLAGKRYEVPEGGLRLGRASTNDICIPDEGLSRNHCLFERTGEDGIRIVDLASANGSYVNGEAVGDAPVALKPGDTVEVGETVLEVVGETPAPVAASSAPAAGSLDLGLGPGKGTSAAPGAAAGAPGGKSPRKALNLVIAAAAAAALGAIYLLLTADSQPAEKSESKGSGKATPVAKAKPHVRSLRYEKVEADGGHIFRYWMEIGADGVLKVAYDDVPGENRHAEKSGKLQPAALEHIDRILSEAEFLALDAEYTGASAATENELKSWRIRFVREDGRVKDTLVENTVAPDAFRAASDALEAFSRNELGIWAIQYSKEKLLELSAASEAAADAKWDERDVEYGNLAESIVHYREAVFYLETVNPKPDGYAELKEKLRRAETTLADRYREQRFLADKAINLRDWEAAKRELRVLCDLVPDKNDERHAEANAKLVDVEKRIKEAKARAKKAKEEGK